MHCLFCLQLTLGRHIWINYLWWFMLAHLTTIVSSNKSLLNKSKLQFSIFTIEVLLGFYRFFEWRLKLIIFYRYARRRMLTFLSVVFALVHVTTCLQCYTCSGKKYLCDSSADPGKLTECPSLFSLIRPSVMIDLGEIGIDKVIDSRNIYIGSLVFLFNNSFRLNL